MNPSVTPTSRDPRLLPRPRTPPILPPALPAAPEANVPSPFVAPPTLRRPARPSGTPSSLYISHFLLIGLDDEPGELGRGPPTDCTSASCPPKGPPNTPPTEERRGLRQPDREPPAAPGEERLAPLREAIDEVE